MKKKVWKRVGIGVALVVALLVGFFGYTGYSNNKNASANIENAHKALANKDWSTAKTYYQQAQDDKKSVEARTAIEQLNYAIRADKYANKQDYKDALKLYQNALDVDGSIAVVNTNVKAVMKTIKASQAAASSSAAAKSSSTAASSTAAASSAAAASAASESAASASRAASESAASSASSAAAAMSSIAAGFGGSDVATATEQIKAAGFSLDENSVRQIMAYMVINHIADIKTAANQWIQTQTAQ
jgi:hypothetical protein